MERLERTDAINKIATKIMDSLDADDRESYILSWWVLDEDDDEFYLLSKDLQNEILLNEDPPGDVCSDRYNELIKIALSSEFRGVTNIFLSENMYELGMGKYEVYGDVEELEVCPCCHYKTLPSRGEYEICRLCGWEDNGVEELEKYSGPNHMTLGEAQEKFRERMSELPLSKWIKE